MTVGQIVIHKNTGSEMRVKIIRKTVATCELINEKKEWSIMREKKVYPIAICAIENLIEQEKQLKMFP